MDEETNKSLRKTVSGNDGCDVAVEDVESLGAAKGHDEASAEKANVASDGEEVGGGISAYSGLQNCRCHQSFQQRVTVSVESLAY